MQNLLYNTIFYNECIYRFLYPYYDTIIFDNSHIKKDEILDGCGMFLENEIETTKDGYRTKINILQIPTFEVVDMIPSQLLAICVQKSLSKLDSIKKIYQKLN